MEDLTHPTPRLKTYLNIKYLFNFINLTLSLTTGKKIGALVKATKIVLCKQLQQVKASSLP